MSAKTRWNMTVQQRARITGGRRSFRAIVIVAFPSNACFGARTRTHLSPSRRKRRAASPGNPTGARYQLCFRRSWGWALRPVHQAWRRCSGAMRIRSVMGASNAEPPVIIRERHSSAEQPGTDNPCSPTWRAGQGPQACLPTACPPRCHFESSLLPPIRESKRSADWHCQRRKDSARAKRGQAKR
jgi:hypothetical protein